jgi:thiol-disulfide isomerase/thioredoxin
VTGGLAALLAALVVAVAAGLAWRATNGKMRLARKAPAPAPESAPAGRVTAADLRQPLGERATLLQFSSAFCAPCRATRVILADVAGRAPGVAHVEIDAESHLDLVRSLGVLRTPTVFVLGPDGAITARASGQPRKADVLGALGVALPAGSSYSPGLKQVSDTEPAPA